MSQRSPFGLSVHRNSHQQALHQFTGSNRDKIDAAKAAVAAFNSIGVDVCTFGSLACKMLGVYCHPKDVDLIVLDDDEVSQEEHKEFLVRSDRQFYMVPSRNPEATYRVLWYRTARGSRVKVDVLHPGVMFIPTFNASDITWAGMTIDSLTSPGISPNISRTLTISMTCWIWSPMTAILIIYRMTSWLLHRSACFPLRECSPILSPIGGVWDSKFGLAGGEGCNRPC
ncbi:hypothetical protein FRC08_015883 [Ceratobasidium sp. 394]|nr:hypothetical protein FRC08_015883 [Ceratobasidium sp. 394]